jgi:HTH-type transcriptional regulator, osmoprotectant uptake regulator
MEMNAIEKDSVALFDLMGHTYGLPDVLVRLIGLLYLQPDEIAMDDLAKKSGYSLASVSGAVKQLEALRMVQRTRKPGSKRIYLSMEKDLLKVNVMKLSSMLEGYVRPMRAMIPGIVDRHKAKAKDDAYRKQVAILESYGRQLHVFDRMLVRWISDLEKARK